jgi:hypothetical protein
MGVLAEESGRSTQGEVTKAKTELGIRAGEAGALTVGEAMVAADGSQSVSTGTGNSVEL